MFQPVFTSGFEARGDFPSIQGAFVCETAALGQECPRDGGAALGKGQTLGTGGQAEGWSTEQPPGIQSSCPG